MAEVTTMILKVDLGCKKCYRKIKSLLCKYPEIQNQVYYEKEDTVVITVVCCSPERIRQKLICKGGKTIKSIEIRVPDKPKPKPPPAPAPPVVVVPEKVEKPKEAEKPKPAPAPEKPKEAEKPKPAPASAPAPAPAPEKPKEAEKPKPAPASAPAPAPAPEKPKEAEKPKAEPAPAPAPIAVAAPAQGYPPFYPIAVCCKPCFDLGYGGPCHHGYGGYGIPYQQPPTSYDGYVRLVPSYDEPAGGWSSGCSCNRSYGGCRCECVVTEETPLCTIM